MVSSASLSRVCANTVLRLPSYALWATATPERSIAVTSSVQTLACAAATEGSWTIVELTEVSGRGVGLVVGMDASGAGLAAEGSWELEIVVCGRREGRPGLVVDGVSGWIAPSWEPVAEARHTGASTASWPAVLAKIELPAAERSALRVAVRCRAVGVADDRGTVPVVLGVQAEAGKGTMSAPPRLRLAQAA